MATGDRTALIETLDRAVTEVLGYFAGAGRTSTAKVDRWQARDVLQHFLYFHDATAWGVQSAAIGGPAWPVPGDSDIVNEVCRRLHAHESYDELLEQIRLSHGQRLDLLAKHWREHVHELQAAEKAGAHR